MNEDDPEIHLSRPPCMDDCGPGSGDWGGGDNTQQSTDQMEAVIDFPDEIIPMPEGVLRPHPHPENMTSLVPKFVPAVDAPEFYFRRQHLEILPSSPVEGAECEAVSLDPPESVDGLPRGMHPEMEPMVMEPITNNDKETRTATTGNVDLTPEPLDSFLSESQRLHISPCTSQPYRWICYLKMTATDDRQYSGTGAFTAMIPDRPGIIITCAHNLYMHKKGGYAKFIDVYPACDGKAAPYRSFRVYPSHYRVTDGYKKHRLATEDYGVIVLPLTEVAGLQKAFGFGYKMLSENKLLYNVAATVCGYPSDKPSGQLYLAGGRVCDVTDKRIFYDTDSSKGQSGSPVYVWDRWHCLLVGIHNIGRTDNFGYYSARRITTDLVEQVKNWAQEMK